VIASQQYSEEAGSAPTLRPTRNGGDSGAEQPVHKRIKQHQVKGEGATTREAKAKSSKEGHSRKTAAGREAPHHQRKPTSRSDSSSSLSSKAEKDEKRKQKPPMGEDAVKEKLTKLHSQLKKAVVQKSIPALTEVIRRVKALPLTVVLLRDTGIGRTVKKLSKLPDDTIAKPASDLFKYFVSVMEKAITTNDTTLQQLQKTPNVTAEKSLSENHVPPAQAAADTTILEKQQQKTTPTSHLLHDAAFSAITTAASASPFSSPAAKSEGQEVLVLPQEAVPTIPTMLTPAVAEPPSPIASSPRQHAEHDSHNEVHHRTAPWPKESSELTTMAPLAAQPPRQG